MVDLYLGLDCSTQSLTGVVIDYDLRQVICKENIFYGKDLKYFNTENGIILFEDKNKVHSNPLMWVEALELLFQKLHNREDVNLGKIKAIGGSGQQHGTVYLNNTFENALSTAPRDELLIFQLEDCFSRETSPIWMDSSTTKECEEIRASLGGKKKTIEITGSNTFERFSGPQIRKFYKRLPKKYINTSMIHLVSSFMASILFGKNAPIDYADGSGMNLMHIERRDWDQNALDATAPDLEEKLPQLNRSETMLGPISSYFSDKYHFSRKCMIGIWSGDNPNSLIGLGLSGKKDAALSLGTSDTYFAYFQDLHLDYTGGSHVFIAPTNDYMGLICFKNGSLAREKIKNQFNLDWETFSKVLKRTPPGNYGRLMLPYFFAEIVPNVLTPQVHRFWLDKNDMEGNVRAIIESQLVSMRLHSAWIKNRPKIISATGGASVNKEILQIAANIFNAKILQFKISKSAVLGATFRAIQSYYCQKRDPVSWDVLIDELLMERSERIISPQEEYLELYNDMVNLYETCENFILHNGKDPQKLRKKFLESYFLDKNV